jgi:hypothetical protein
VESKNCSTAVLPVSVMRGVEHPLKPATNITPTAAHAIQLNKPFIHLPFSFVKTG